MRRGPHPIKGSINTTVSAVSSTHPHGTTHTHAYGTATTERVVLRVVEIYIMYVSCKYRYWSTVVSFSVYSTGLLYSHFETHKSLRFCATMSIQTIASLFKFLSDLKSATRIDILRSSVIGKLMENHCSVFCSR